ncbi:hypothetical protein Clacol_000609 [Clathrus columnatus]|uniref:Vacuolar protein sorting-associated protein 8 central domain-containing protein n=1 Tax=Clathrus columnatus TaxID=1419009 RepID=A0AAV5A1B1_9AGAM|nr:hypothetical protein Clacol_000609 [Clathrus columnatus]
MLDNQGADIHSLAKEGEEEDGSEGIDFSNYAVQLEEALGEDEDDEDFLYEEEGSYQQPPATYDEQLHNILRDGENNETSSIDGNQSENDAGIPQYDTSLKIEISRQSTPSSSNYQPSNLAFIETRPRLSGLFPHSTSSRLRSFISQPETAHILSVPALEPAHTPRTSLSGTSSPTAIMNSSDEVMKRSLKREVFRWTSLKDLGQHIFAKKVTSILGSSFGEPTVLAVHGLICIGTDRAYALVFDFKQELICICKSDVPSDATGAVTAVALSRDHTYVAVGYSRGYVNLFEIARPHTPARVVIPTTLTVVASGRKEGHIEGVKITGIDFIGSRHTAIISMDESGLAFYHSLGKVLFVEATDTIRILGKYSDIPVTTHKDEIPVSINNGAGEGHPKIRKSNIILAMASLPLGPIQHPVENYSVVALLTSSKLVIVGLKPAPRTWHRKYRSNLDELPTENSKWRGCVAWLPSLAVESVAADGSIVSDPNLNVIKKGATYTLPLLAYSWDCSIYLLQLSEKKALQKAGNSKATSIDVGSLEFKELANWSTDADYLSLQWFNAYLLLACTATHIEVWDIRRPSRVENVQTPIFSLSPLTSQKNADYGSVAHCFRTYKGKIFHLCQHELRVGIIMSWADRILSCVDDGDFLSAIEIARTYYTSTAPGNCLGLPEDETALKALVGPRLRDLMSASARYAFSEDRLTDSTHVTPENRGVDRTSLFENMVNTCLDACIALDDFEFIFEDLFEFYQVSGITPIFLRQLEPYILDGTIRMVPPRITQKLIAMHESRGNYDHAERIIWHIDPECLDVDQALTLCRKQKLYDALIYVYTTSLKDYVTPLIELMNLIRQVQKIRYKVFSSNHLDEATEALVTNAYRIFPYLTSALTGMIYPNQRLMALDGRTQAKKDIYSFLFFGRSYIWPQGEGGKLIATCDDGENEPTYPYVRLLLQFDAEAFLHTMDIAFEDEYFNDETQFISRLVIIKILLEILPSPDLSSNVKTMMNIFISRNVPKYPQSIYTYMTPSSLQTVLLNLTADNDTSTREDRQLAAEYLLSVYNPHDHEEVVKLFSQAGFYRILRVWYRSDRKWESLVSTYIEDPDVDPTEIFESLDEVLSLAKRENKGYLPKETLDVVLGAIPHLLETEVTETAVLVDKHLQDFHQQVLDKISSPHKQFIYLRCLLEPSALPEDSFWYNASIRQRAPSLHLPVSAREFYLRLLCQYDAGGVIRCLDSLSDNFFPAVNAISICEESDIHEAIVWMLDRQGDTKGAFDKLKVSTMNLTLRLGESLNSEREKPETSMHARSLLDKLINLGDIGLQICLNRSATGSSGVEDFWFELLASQVDAAQNVSAFSRYTNIGVQPYFHDEEALASLRSLVQKTFTSLISLGPSSTLSFPRLFKRLVESVSSSTSNHSSYSEFKVILTSMMDSYRGEGDLLTITGHLVERDLFEAVEQLSRSRLQGSRARGITCSICKHYFEQNSNSAVTTGESDSGLAVQRFSGLAFHRKCLPAVFASG